MKRLAHILLGFFLLTATGLASEKSEAYPVKHFSFVSSADVTELLRDPSTPLLVVFSDGSCLWSSMPARNCLLFERELDLHAEALKARGWRVVAVDAGFRYPELIAEHNVRLRPTIKIFSAASGAMSLEPSPGIDWDAHDLTWQAELMNRVLEATN